MVLVVNTIGEQASIADLDNYHLPVLQDTETERVFELWDAGSYDLFIIDRTGTISYIESGAHPADDYDRFVELLSSYE